MVKIDLNIKKNENNFLIGLGFLLFLLLPFLISSKAFKNTPVSTGAHNRIWTGDLFLTKEVLYPWAMWAGLWSGWWGSNPHHQLGRLRFYHWTTPAHALVGGGRIRTCEGWAVRFTVWSLWPLGNPSKTRHLQSVHFPPNASFCQDIIEKNHNYSGPSIRDNVIDTRLQQIDENEITPKTSDNAAFFYEWLNNLDQAEASQQDNQNA